jgi:hypothetical protein
MLCGQLADGAQLIRFTTKWILRIKQEQKEGLQLGLWLDQLRCGGGGYHGN